jgi:hypothetical protein
MAAIRTFSFGQCHDCSNFCLGSNSSNFSLKCSKRPRDKVHTEVPTYSPQSRRVRPIMDTSVVAGWMEMSILWGANQSTSPPHREAQSGRARHPRESDHVLRPVSSRSAPWIVNSQPSECTLMHFHLKLRAIHEAKATERILLGKLFWQANPK